MVINVLTGASCADKFMAVAMVPAISVQPIDRVVQPGTNVSLTVEATGSAPLHYQWRRGGTAVTGATDATLTLTSVQFANVGTYDVVVSNTAGSATSAPATLSLTGLLAPEITTQPKSQYANPGSSVTLSLIQFQLMKCSKPVMPSPML